jgi:diguanylate cyclase (GGDEF)-like protein
MEVCGNFEKSRIIKIAETYLSQGKIDAAINEYEKLLKLDSNAYSSINGLGDLYARLGRIEDAKSIFKRIAESYCENGFTLKAIAMYKKLYKLDPENNEIPLKIGDLYAKQNLVVEAKQWYLTIAGQYKEKGQTLKSLEVLRKVVDLEPENATLWFQLAERYQHNGFSCEAHEAFLQAGRVFLQQNQSAKAVEAYQKALTIYTHSNPAIKSLVYILIQQNELKKALLLLNRSLERSPDDIDLLTLLGRTCLNANLLEEAESAFSYLFELDQSRFCYLLEVCNRFVEKNLFDQALSIIDRCGEFLISSRREEKAASLIKKILELDPGNLEAVKRLTRFEAKQLKIISGVAEQKQPQEDEKNYFDLVEYKDYGNSDDPNFETDEIDLSNILFDTPSAQTVVMVAQELDQSSEEYDRDLADSYCFDTALKLEWRRAMRSSAPISLILIDIDLLGNYPESYGGQSYDPFLIQIAGALNREVKRAGDLVAIYNRSQIAILLPEVYTNGAAIVGSRLLSRINSMKTSPEWPLPDRPVSIVSGISSAFPQRYSSPDTLMAKARESLDQAKRPPGDSMITAALPIAKTA